MNTRILLTLSVDLDAAAKALAEEQFEGNKSLLIRTALREYLEVRKQSSN